MTEIYLIRHSEPLNVNNKNSKDTLQVQNEKKILSINGEKIAKETFDKDIFNNIDCVYSSNYIRAISTAKYVAEKNNLEVNIVDDLGERKFGISSWNELPTNFERKQFLDENYKIGDGENQKEVRDRMYSSIMKILGENKNKRIVIVSHATAISYLLKKWCEVSYDNDYKFKNNIFFDGKWNYCETFGLRFDDKDLISIERI